MFWWQWSKKEQSKRDKAFVKNFFIQRESGAEENCSTLTMLILTKWQVSSGVQILLACLPFHTVIY
jgi:hypothetical protein